MKGESYGTTEAQCYPVSYTHLIAKQMMEEKRPSAYVDNWDASHVHCILTNEKYVGDVLMQTKYTVDHLTHKEVKNRDHVLPSYYAVSYTHLQRGRNGNQ